MVLALTLRKTLRSNANLKHGLLATRSEYLAAIERYRQVERVVKTSVGGVQKRIDEIREIMETIDRHAPRLFDQASGLIFWLKATDEFLCALRDNCAPMGADSYEDQKRDQYAKHGRTASIYASVEAAKSATHEAHRETYSPKLGRDTSIRRT